MKQPLRRTLVLFHAIHQKTTARFFLIVKALCNSMFFALLPKHLLYKGVTQR